MSKFLKIIVNICIICFLLTGVALIVPQLVGVTTVVVDDSVTESNVGIGSVVYAKKVELSDLGVGDKLLRSSNTSCYVSKITEADPKTGIYKVEGADGAESVTLRNTAEKTYIVVPAIGFVSIAMQSFEGRIILGLVLAVLVILYILSEIWKKNSEDAEEDLDTEENEQEEKSGKQKESQEDLQETEAASKNTESKTEEDSLQELETPQEEAPLELILEDVSQTQKTVTQNTATISEAELKELESAMTGDSVPEVEVEEEAFVESGEAAEIVEVETEEVEAPLEVPDKEEMDADVALEAPKTEEADITPETVKTEENRVDLETKAKADSVGQETKAEADSVDSETETQENSGKDDLKLTDVAEDSLEAAIIQAAAVAESEQAEALRAAETRPEVTFEPLPSEEKVKQEEELEEDGALLRQRIENLHTSYDIDREFYNWPICGRDAMLGVLRIPIENAEKMSEAQIRLLRSMIESMALAMDRFRSAQERLHSKEEIAQERYRGNLLRAISHDLRTPLAGIMGTSEMLMGMTDRQDARYGLAEGIYKDADWLHSLVENILNLTRLQDGRLVLNKQVEAVEEVIGAALSAIGKRASEYEITVNIPDNLMLVPMDARLIDQVLVNLLDNAVKHTPPEKEISVTVEEDKERQLAVFTVADRGTGIAVQDLPLVFQMFYTTHAKEPDAQRGVGLGLTICESIVKAHGGTLSAQNRKDGDGAMFIFTLPLEVTENDQQQ